MGSKISISVLIRLILWVVMLGGGGVAGIWLDLWLFPQLASNWGWHLASLLAGAALLKLVFRMSRVTGRALARQGRVGELPRMETNRLVTSGPYECMRHPMHLGLLLFPWAVALIIGSPSFLLYIAPVEMLLSVILIITLEEREVRHKFGLEYLAYRQRVPAFSLRPACLRRLLGLAENAR
ncbi:MAG: isoprenylcysteine carboxylmethyltransferase family protein [Gammaproteobacteria bacterium]|nr:isoprenylcysteine carboxylmethyltransferase family protein [Gammaproteobacteria bacterium]MBU1653739.1 isoprenylcysteine carboxylmethyltransferase family protein [Gammaproteobacteria bacterium]MBU1959616.1 isoprenylcysteine carboxylmethyltransferase family protein [Gammaproteobacteria bacterium]